MGKMTYCKDCPCKDARKPIVQSTGADFCFTDISLIRKCLECHNQETKRHLEELKRQARLTSKSASI